MIRFYPVMIASGLYGNPRLSGLALCEQHAPNGDRGLETKKTECDKCLALSGINPFTERENN